MKNPEIIIYTTDWCPYCKKAKKYLDDKKLNYVERNIEEDSTAQQELSEKIGGRFRGVPVIDINGVIVQGFTPDEIDTALVASQ